MFSTISYRARENHTKEENKLLSQVISYGLDVSMASEILKPGTKIKPQLDAEKAKVLLWLHYGIKTNNICELNSYDDRNFLVTADKNVKNDNIKNFCEDGYILKILNSFDSKKTAFVEGQTQLSIFLNEKNFSAPKQLQLVDGRYYHLEGENIIRLYEFIPGKIFYNVPPCPNLFYHAGVYLAKLGEALKNFNHEGYEQHRTLWMLTSVPNLREFVNVVNEAQRGMVEDIIDDFQKNVLDHYDEFPKQVIHGDFNEQNILVGKPAGKEFYQVTGFIDYGDTQKSCLFFELCIALTYMILQTGEIETGGFFLAGYRMVRLIPPREMKLLKLGVCARLCQSLVLGLYSHQFDKDNDYLLTTQKVGWRVLEALHSRSVDEVNDIWNSVADGYLTQSIK